MTKATNAKREKEIRAAQLEELKKEEDSMK